LFVVIAAAGLGDLWSQGSASPWGAAASLVGLAAIVGGGLIAGRGVWDLRASLSPFPRPVAGAPLIESGAYRLIRHPIYSGLVLGAVGWGMVTGSILATASAGLLFLLFAGKSRRDAAKKAKRTLEDLGVRFLGVVVNNVKAERESQSGISAF